MIGFTRNALPMMSAALLLLSGTAEAVAAEGADAARAPMPEWAVSSAVDMAMLAAMGVLAVCMLLCVYRLMRGPHLADRSLAVDTLGVVLIGLVAVFTVRFRTSMFLDGILVLSLLGFAGTVALAQYIGRPHMHKRRRGAPPVDGDGDGDGHARPAGAGDGESAAGS